MLLLVSECSENIQKLFSQEKVFLKHLKPGRFEHSANIQKEKKKRFHNLMRTLAKHA